MAGEEVVSACACAYVRKLVRSPTYRQQVSDSPGMQGPGGRGGARRSVCEVEVVVGVRKGIGERMRKGTREGVGEHTHRRQAGFPSGIPGSEGAGRGRMWGPEARARLGEAVEWCLGVGGGLHADGEDGG
jgi:hypothetical protein